MFFLYYLRKHIRWSRAAFGPDQKTQSILNHIRKELVEIEASPRDLEEWIDVTILALDGAWRAGHSPFAIARALWKKQRINRARAWKIPEDENAPIEHIRD